MKKKILIGSTLSVVILILVSIAPSINANADNPLLDTSQEDVATPIVLVLQLITKLRNYNGIENIESEDEILQIIEQDEELNSIYEQLSDEDCGCEDDTTPLEWGFPVICVLLVPWLAFALMLLLMGGYNLLGQIVGTIGLALNCWWTQF